MAWTSKVSQMVLIGPLTFADKCSQHVAHSDTTAVINRLVGSKNKLTNKTLHHTHFSFHFQRPIKQTESVTIPLWLKPITGLEHNDL